LAVAGVALADHQPGTALVLAFAALVPVALLPGAGTAWPLAAAAPALGAVGLAGAWPAACAVPRLRLARRAALAATGWVWIVVATRLTGSGLYLIPAPSLRSQADWARSLPRTVHEVLGPLVFSGLLAPAIVWAAAAVVLPWLVRGRSLAHDLIAVTIWSALLFGATAATLRAAGYAAPPAAAILGTLAGALIALAPALRGVRASARESASPPGELA
jgi:hypothetical protein